MSDSMDYDFSYLDYCNMCGKDVDDGVEIVVYETSQGVNHFICNDCFKKLKQMFVKKEQLNV